MVEGTPCRLRVDSRADLKGVAKAYSLAWFRQFLEFDNGLPSHGMFGHVLSRLATGEFLRGITTWIRESNFEREQSCVAIGGKTLRGSYDVAHSNSGPAWSNRLRQM